MRTDLSNPSMHKFIEKKKTLQEILLLHLGDMVRAFCYRNAACFGLRPPGRRGLGGGTPGV